MPPEQNYNQPAPSNDYSFINDTDSQPRRSFFDGSPKSLIILLGGVLFAIIILFVIFQSLKPASLEPQLISLAAEQQEIVRVAGIQGKKMANGQNAANLAASVTATIQSQQNQLLTYLTANGAKVESKLLVAAMNPNTDKNLSTAASSNNFDSAFTEEMVTELTTYRSNIGKIIPQLKGQTLKSQLTADVSAINMLLDQAKNGSTQVLQPDNGPGGN